MTATNWYSCIKKLKTLNSETACYHSLQNILSSCHLSRSLNIKIYRTTVLLIILYGCETWSLSQWKEHRFLSENRVLRNICGPKREEVRGDWRKLHNEGLHNLDSTYLIRVIQSWRMRLVGHVAHTTDMKCIQNFSQKTWREETTWKA
jgi:hypothetical protein